MSAGAVTVSEELDAERAVRLLMASLDWIRDCVRWRGEVLVGRFAHWCEDWDGLPVDETCSEWPCACAPALQANRGPDSGARRIA